jgi:hypothetical protein
LPTFLYMYHIQTQRLHLHVPVPCISVSVRTVRLLHCPSRSPSPSIYMHHCCPPPCMQLAVRPVSACLSAASLLLAAPLLLVSPARCRTPLLHTLTEWRASMTLGLDGSVHVLSRIRDGVEPFGHHYLRSGVNDERRVGLEVLTMIRRRYRLHTPATGWHGDMVFLQLRAYRVKARGGT